MHNGSVCEEKRKSEYRKGATYKYALLKAKSLPESFSGRWGCSNRQQCQRTCDPWILYREEKLGDDRYGQWSQ